MVTRNKIRNIKSGDVKGDLVGFGPILLISSDGGGKIDTNSCGVFRVASPLGLGLRFHNGIFLPLSQCKNENVRSTLIELKEIEKGTYCDRVTAAGDILERIDGYEIIPLDDDRSAGALALNPDSECMRMLRDNFLYVSEIKDDPEGGAVPESYSPFKWNSYGELMEWFYTAVKPSFDSWKRIKIHVLFEGLEGCVSLDFFAMPQEIKALELRIIDHFQLRADTEPSRVVFKSAPLNFAYGNFSIIIDDRESVLFFSDVYPPQENLIRWLQDIECGKLPVQMEMDEDGFDSYLEAHPTEREDLIFIIYGDQYSTQIKIQAVVDRKLFVDEFRSELSKYVQEAFDLTRWKHCPFDDEKELAERLMNDFWLHSLKTDM